MILSEGMGELIEALEEKYGLYYSLDTPPVGLVSDALFNIVM
jgi:hypothetical protein